VTGEVGDRRLVQPGSRVNVHSVGNVLGWLDSFTYGRVQRLVLARRGEQQTSVWCKRKSSEKGR
jgi:hypothetical protein